MDTLKRRSVKLLSRPRMLGIDGFEIGVTEDGDLDFLFYQYEDPGKNQKKAVGIASLRIPVEGGEDIANAITEAIADYKKYEKKHR